MATGPTTHAPLRTPTRGNHGQFYHLINMIIFNIIALVIINNYKNKHHDYQNQIDSVKGVQLKLLKMVMQWTTLGAIVWMGVLALVSIFGYCISGYHDIDCDVLGVECDDEYFSIQEGECRDFLFFSFQIF